MEGLANLWKWIQLLLCFFKSNIGFIQHSNRILCLAVLWAPQFLLISFETKFNYSFSIFGICMNNENILKFAFSNEFNDVCVCVFHSNVVSRNQYTLAPWNMIQSVEVMAVLITIHAFSAEKSGRNPRSNYDSSTKNTESFTQ